MKQDHHAGEGSVIELFLDAVLEIAGSNALRSILETYAGCEVYLAVRPTKANWLVREFGFEVAEKIGAKLASFDADGKPIGQLRTTIPRGKLAIYARLNGEADRLLMEGVKANEIARRLDIHARTVWRRRAALVASGKLKKGRWR